jgi:hypothetical protein
LPKGSEFIKLHAVNKKHHPKGTIAQRIVPHVLNTLTNLKINAIPTPVFRINLTLNQLMKGRVWPIFNLINMAMLIKIILRVVYMRVIVRFISNAMFSKAPLPYTSFAAFLSHG